MRWRWAVIAALVLMTAPLFFPRPVPAQDVTIRIAPEFCGIFTVFLVDSDALGLWQDMPANPETLDATGVDGVIARDDGAPGAVSFAFVSGDANETAGIERVFRPAGIGTFPASSVGGPEGADIGLHNFEIRQSGPCEPVEWSTMAPASQFAALMAR